MIRVKYLVLAILISLAINSLTDTSQAITTDDLLYNPSPEFVDDFFLALAEGSYVYPAQDGALVLRRLYSFSESVNNDDYVTAWQTLLNIPEDPGYPVTGEIKHKALVIQAIIPWFKDKELKENFMQAFEDIWLKYNGIRDDYGTFKEVFGGFASRKDTDHPAVYIRDHVSYYGYTGGPEDPEEDIEFIWNLFRDFSTYADAALKDGIDYRTADPGAYSHRLMNQLSLDIQDAWKDAVMSEKIRSGDDEFKIDESFQDHKILSEIELAPPPEPEIIDYSKLNVFLLPASVSSAWGDEKFIETQPEVIPADSFIDISEPFDDSTDKSDNPMLNGEGLEPPEPYVGIESDDVIVIPSIEDEDILIETPTLDDVPDKTEPDMAEAPITDEKAEIPETRIQAPDEEPTDKDETEITDRIDQDESVKPAEDKAVTEQPVESVFVTPNLTVVETDTAEITPVQEDETVEIPKADDTDKETVEVPIDATKSVDLLSQIKPEPVDDTPGQTPEQPVEKPVELPVEPEPISNEQELYDISNKLINQTFSTAEELGTLAVDLVLLWSEDPANVENYDDTEAELENNFRARKEEFLALLFINDSFRIENDLGTSFEALNEKINASLMKHYDDIKSRGVLDDNPNIQEEDLLRAIGQLTQGVVNRRETPEIEEASLKAFRLRRSQFAEEISRLQELKKIDLSE